MRIIPKTSLDISIPIILTQKVSLYIGIFARGKATAKGEFENYTIVISMKFRIFSPTRKKIYLPEEKLKRIIA